jgi:competence protein ComEA
MRRALGAVVVMALIGLWNFADALLLRPHPSPIERVAPARSAPVFQPGKLDPLPPATVTRAQPVHDRLAGSSFRADPFAFLSSASADSLDLLPGVGPVLAARIIESRRIRGSFASWNDVLAVKGIGPATVARWRSLAGQ